MFFPFTPKWPVPSEKRVASKVPEARKAAAQHSWCHWDVPSLERTYSSGYRWLDVSKHLETVFTQQKMSTQIAKWPVPIHSIRVSIGDIVHVEGKDYHPFSMSFKCAAHAVWAADGMRKSHFAGHQCVDPPMHLPADVRAIVLWRAISVVISQTRMGFSEPSWECNGI